MLDYLARSTHQQGQHLAEMQRRLTRLEQDCQSIKRTHSELMVLLQQVNRKTFSLKEEGFEVVINVFTYTRSCTHFNSESIP